MSEYSVDHATSIGELVLPDVLKVNATGLSGDTICPGYFSLITDLVSMGSLRRSSKELNSEGVKWQDCRSS